MQNNFIDRLPDEIKNIIYNYINIKYRIFLNKINYIRYNHIICQYIDSRNYFTYIRNIIRYDDVFVFTPIMHRNFTTWFNKSNYIYKNVTYSNYIIYLMDYSKKHSSFKIFNILNEKFVLTRVKKKWIKSNRTKNNIWIV